MNSDYESTVPPGEPIKVRMTDDDWDRLAILRMRQEVFAWCKPVGGFSIRRVLPDEELPTSGPCLTCGKPVKICEKYLNPRTGKVEYEFKCESYEEFWIKK